MHFYFSYKDRELRVNDRWHKKFATRATECFWPLILSKYLMWGFFLSFSKSRASTLSLNAHRMNENEQNQHKSTGNIATVHWLYWMTCVFSIDEIGSRLFPLKTLTLTYNCSLIDFHIDSCLSPHSLLKQKISLCTCILTSFNMNEHLIANFSFQQRGVVNLL